MRARTVAALYDVHGNLPALEAVLAELESAAPELVVVGGDVCAGPFPHETLERLAALGECVHFVRGNADRAVAVGEGEPGEAWAAERLTPEQRHFLAGLPLAEAVEVTGLGRVLFCHATPRSDEEIVTRLTPDGHLAGFLAGVDAEVIVCGHVHVRYDRAVAGKRVVNPGSVGLPYEGEPGAYWALLGPDVDFRRTPYPVDEAVERIRASGFPGGEAMFVEALLVPPAPEAVSEHFERLAHGR